MKYISKNLTDGELINYEGRVHKFYVFFFGTIAFLGPILFIYGIYNPIYLGTPTGFRIIHPAFVMYMMTFLFIILFGIYKYLFLISSEIAITNKRIIHKTGFIARNVFELQLSKVESARIKQSIFQRIIGAGTLSINGAGVHYKPIKYLSEPIKMRTFIYEKIDQHSD